MKEGKTGGDPGAQGQSAHVGAAKSEVVEEIPEVERPAAEGVARRVPRAIRARVAPRLPEDDATPSREAGRIWRPHVGVAADPVGEHEWRRPPARPGRGRDRGRGAVLLVV